MNKASNPDRKLFILLMDLKGSTQIHKINPDAVYLLVGKLMADMNREYKKDIEIPLQLNYGDEISGLFNNPLACYRCVNKFYKLLKDVIGFRYCVSEGDISFPSNDMTEIGGTAFKRANRVMDTKLKRKKWRFCEWALEHSVLSQTVTSLANLCFELKEKMTNLQWEVYRGYSEGLEPAKLSEDMQRSVNSIYQLNIRSGGHIIHDSEYQIELLLAEYNDKMHNSFIGTQQMDNTHLGSTNG